jgi:hypothetical protein
MRVATSFGALAGLILALTACSGRTPAPQPILVPTPVHCVTGDIPDEPPRISESLTGDSGVDIGLIAGSAIELRAWGQALRGMVEACRGPAG